MMTLLTDFGDSAVLLPLSAAMLLWLLAMRAKIGAAWWFIAIALCTGGTALLKIYFIACPIGALHSPSGHASFSALVYGAMAIIVAAEQAARWQRIAALAAGAALVGGIAVSRLALGAHSLLEVVLGTAIGAVTLAVFAQGYLSRRPTGVTLTPLLLAVALIGILLHGRELHAEEILYAIGRYFNVSLMACG